MDRFIHLFLGHLVGDYVLQNKFIASYKQKKLKVLLMHIILIFFSQVSFFSGKDFNINSIYIISFVTLVHFFIDFFKYKNNNKQFFKSPKYYLIDQLMHIFTLFLASIFSTQTFFYIPDKLAVILISAIFNAYFLGIYTFILKNNVSEYKRDIVGYIVRGLCPVFYIFGPIVYSVYTLLTGFFSLYFLKSYQVISWALSIISTIIFMEVLL